MADLSTALALSKKEEAFYSAMFAKVRRMRFKYRLIYSLDEQLSSGNSEISAGDAVGFLRKSGLADIVLHQVLPHDRRARRLTRAPGLGVGGS